MAADQPGGKEWLHAAWGLAGLLGLALLFGWLVLERPLSYLEAFAAIVIGHRLVERGLAVKHRGILLLPGIAALLFLIEEAEQWQTYLLMLGVAWLIEVTFLQVRHWYKRAFVQALPVNHVFAGGIPRQTVTVDVGEEVDAVFEAGRPLSEEQASRLRQLGREGSLPVGQMIELEQTIPFVPFIVGGVVLSAFFAGNLVPPLIELVVWLKG